MKSSSLRRAQGLVGGGCLIGLAGALLHLVAGYPRAAAALAASNLSLGLQQAFDAVFFLTAVTWMVLFAAAAIAVFAYRPGSRITVLVCDLGLLAEIPIWLWLMGWFIGNEIFAVSAGLIVAGGLLLPKGGAAARAGIADAGAV